VTTAPVIYRRALDAVSGEGLAGDDATFPAMINLPNLVRKGAGTKDVMS
jgi:hypothetical protein